MLVFSGLAANRLFVAIGLGLLAAPAMAVTFSDTTFNPANYTLTTYAPAAVTTSFGQTASGNPGTALQGTYATNAVNPDGELFVALNNGFVYNPGTSGRIGSLDVSLDRYFDPKIAGTSVPVGSYTLRVFAAQASSLYQAIYNFGPAGVLGGDWYTLAQSGLAASDFKLFDPANYTAAGSAIGLDYGGGAITFGFAMRAAAAFDAGGVTTQPTSGVLRADNFKVTAGAVPEPASWMLMVGGFGLAGAALRRSRRTAAIA